MYCILATKNKIKKIKQKRLREIPVPLIGIEEVSKETGK